MDTQSLLTTLGLEEKQAQTYLALLELGTASVQSIAQKAGLKRPTTYLILDELEQKGLAIQVPQHTKQLYTAESPEKLLREVKKKEELLRRFLPDLLALHNAKKEKPQVQLFQGVEGIKEVYNQIYESSEVWFFATLGDLQKQIPEVTKNVSRLAKEKKLKVKEILSGTEADIQYASQVPTGEYYQVRFIPKPLAFFTDNGIYGDKVAFFSFKPYLFAVVIESKDIVNSLKSLYELAWRSSNTAN